MHIHTTCVCGQFLDTADEQDYGLCAGCAIDLYERERDMREQAWLEDDRNWPEDVSGESGQ